MTVVFWQGQVGGSKVFCDMCSTTSGGGWQLFVFYSATKKNLKENDLSAYRSGFSNDTVYWLGLDKLHQLTSTSFGAQLHIEVVGGDGFKWAEYDNFSVGSFEERFKLTIGGYNNKSTLVNAMELHDGALFSVGRYQKVDGYPFDEDIYPWDNDVMTAPFIVICSQAWPDPRVNGGSGKLRIQKLCQVLWLGWG